MRVDTLSNKNGSAGEKLGQYLSSEQDYSKAVVIADLDVNKRERAENRLKGFRRGFQGDIVDVARPRLSDQEREQARQRWENSRDIPGSPDDDGNQLPAQAWFTAKKMDDMVRKQQGECDVVVSLIGLPQNSQEMKTLTDNQSPALAVCAPQNVGRNVKRMVQSGNVVAAVSVLPAADQDIAFDDPKRPPDDLDKAFAKKYQLFTSR